jgi:TonB family protein
MIALGWAKILKTVVSAFILAATCSGTARASDCARFRTIASSVQPALVESEPYSHEGDEEAAEGSYRAAVHFLDLAKAYGEPSTCLSENASATYYVLVFQLDHLKLVYEAETVPEMTQMDELMRHFATSFCDNDFRTRHPQAYREIRASVRDADHLVASERLRSEQEAAQERADAECKAAGPNEDASILSVVEPDCSEAAATNAPPGVAQIKVTLDVSGAVTGAEIYKSSGNALVDQATVRAAEASRFSLETICGKKTKGSFIFRGEFSGSP